MMTINVSHNKEIVVIIIKNKASSFRARLALIMTAVLLQASTSR
jgi:hypothetical protein